MRWRPAAQPGPQVFTLTAFCTLHNLQDFKLDPPQGSQSQHALIIVSDSSQGVTARKSPNLIVESVMLLHRDDVAEVKHAMHKMLYYIAAASEINTRKRKREWTETFSPAQARKCRQISKHPTGEVLPEYKGSSSRDTKD